MIGIQGRVVILVAVVTMTVGCRSLPYDYELTEPTYALQPAREGPLAVFSTTCVERVDDGESCFLLLEKNDEDLQWRLALIDSARISLDLQTLYGPELATPSSSGFSMIITQ